MTYLTKAWSDPRVFVPRVFGFVLALALFFPGYSHAITVMTANMEFFWDSKEPHEGARIVFGTIGSPPSPHQVQLEAFAMAQVIRQQKADVVGLTEVENRDVVDLIRGYLGKGWKVVFKKGRDTGTGQDVAILHRFRVVRGSIDNWSDASKGESVDGTKKAKPSKVLGVKLRHGQETFYVVVTHLISKRADNDNKREAQADAVRKVVAARMADVDHTIVMGDFNDTPGSPTLKRIRGIGLRDGKPKLAQIATVSGPNADFTYVFKGKKNLIDHILVSPGLASGAKFYTVYLGPISDHRAAVAVLKD